MWSGAGTREQAAADGQPRQEVRGDRYPDQHVDALDQRLMGHERGDDDEQERGEVEGDEAVAEAVGAVGVALVQAPKPLGQVSHAPGNARSGNSGAETRIAATVPAI